MLRSLPYLNSPTMALAGASRKVARALGDTATRTEVDSPSALIEEMAALSARVTSLATGAPATPHVVDALRELSRASTQAASDMRYASTSEARVIVDDFRRRVDDVTEIVAAERAVIGGGAPGETRGFPGGATLALLAGAALFAVGSIVILAKRSRRRRRRR